MQRKSCVKKKKKAFALLLNSCERRMEKKRGLIKQELFIGT